jgi:hypothetical protein
MKCKVKQFTPGKAPGIQHREIHLPWLSQHLTQIKGHAIPQYQLSYGLRNPGMAGYPVAV